MNRADNIIEAASPKDEAAKVRKSTWAAFIKDAKLGLAYLGSRFNHPLDKAAAVISKASIDPEKLYISRKLTGGSSALRMQKLDDNGMPDGTSTLSKKGTVYRAGAVYIIINPSDGDSAVFYGIPSRDNEALQQHSNDKFMLSDTKDEAKPYTKKGRMMVFKKPIDIGNGVELLARGRDVNGNALVRFTKGASSARSVQMGSDFAPSADDMMSMDKADNARMLKHLKVMSPKVF